jgi:hypothetical protein
MNDAFISVTERIEAFIARSSADAQRLDREGEFNALALELYALQFREVPPYRRFCESRHITPDPVRSWEDIPAMPVSAFKQVDVTSLAPEKRTHVFYSSGTTVESRSRHFHDPASLHLYEKSAVAAQAGAWRCSGLLLFLTPPPSLAPHSSLVHMFDVFRRAFGDGRSEFFGAVDDAGDWQVHVHVLLEAPSRSNDIPVTLMGTAFNLVHVLDHLTAANQQLQLPAGSFVLETGGYKGRSRIVPKGKLYELIEERLGVPTAHIISEYGMCELSSQAYDTACEESAHRFFRFPPWARYRVVSPENGRAAALGEPGILQVFDLANVRSVLAIQTEDVAVATDAGFELLGRATDVQARGCSLMSA